jgi:hypothetical protein
VEHLDTQAQFEGEMNFGPEHARRRYAFFDIQSARSPVVLSATALNELMLWARRLESDGRCVALRLCGDTCPNWTQWSAEGYRDRGEGILTESVEIRALHSVDPFAVEL